jgi:hypothetical protein
LEEVYKKFVVAGEKVVVFGGIVGAGSKMSCDPEGRIG